MKEPQIGHIGIYRGRFPRWWQHGVQWRPLSEFRADLCAGEVATCESVSYIAWRSYRGRKAEWKTYYRGGTSC